MQLQDLMNLNPALWTSIATITCTCSEMRSQLSTSMVCHALFVTGLTECDSLQCHADADADASTAPVLNLGSAFCGASIACRASICTDDQPGWLK